LTLQEHPFIRRAVVAVAAAFAALGAAPAAQAGLFVSGDTGCTAAGELSQPFLRFADPMRYYLAPGGSFESGATGWQLSGASVVEGNESFKVGGAAHHRSLKVASGGAAVTPQMCVGVDSPSFRFFARNTGSLLGTLEVELVYQDDDDRLRVQPLPSLGASAFLSWQPSAPRPVSIALPLLPGEETPVALRFRASGIGSAWQIDDVYVDPYRRS
jgi:hypothetical protein